MKLAALSALIFLLAAQDKPQDAKDLQAQGMDLLQTKPAEAIKLFRQALRLNPDLPELHHQLGLAYHAIGDEADAESELRDAAEATPDSAQIHNDLGIALFQQGNAKAALEEFRTATKLSPKDANAHFNLGESLARTGESNAALEELKIAAALTPDDASLSKLVKVVEERLAAPENRIRVDVRQVVVPVIVTDHDGHHITGLSKDDFKVYEDGVEQKITAFNVESAGISEADIPAPTASASHAATTTKGSTVRPAGVRRTYLILIDTLHSSFNNFTAERDALAKLFQQEHSPDSQYVVIALGVTPDIVVNTTSDTAAVMAALNSKKFQKTFLEGQVGGMKVEMIRFRSDMVDVRYACNQAALDQLMAVKCQVGIARVQQQAQQIAELDRTLTIGFLRQFRALVSQLTHARDRRTVLFLSEGFQIEPGREALGLVNAYFPPASHCLVPETIYCPPGVLISTERMQAEFEPILRLAAASNITIDTIDSRGLYGQSEFDASNGGNPTQIDSAVGHVVRDAARASGNTLSEIAEATGGTAFRDSNDLIAGLQRAVADGRDYYTLSYISPNGNPDGKFRTIAVQVRDKKVLVNAKRGYWAAAQ